MRRGRCGLLVIRAYLEETSSIPLRAEIRLTTDVLAGVERAVHLTDPDAVAELVQKWLSDLAATGKPRQ